MLIPHRFDVTNALTRGGLNHVAVRIDSPVLGGRARIPDVMENALDLHWESLAVRKAPHMYGWDIMPRLLSAGLWRSARLEVLNPTRWRSVYCTTLAASPAERSAQILVDWDFTTERFGVDDLKVRILLERHGQILHESEYQVFGTHGRKRIDLRDVDLWWPRGYGTPALYDLTLELLEGDRDVIDAYTQKLGVRTVALDRTEITSEDEGGEFVFRVNGEKIFIKGTNWVPLDALHGRDGMYLAPTLELAKDLNCNMIRCWGGNVYEDDPFFDFCDANGILVWQDFAMACAVYPQTDDFAAKITIEAETVVRRLRNHACLALWAGNNEIDQVFEPNWGGLGLNPNSERISREILPPIIRRLDPVRDYLPSSPYYSPTQVAGGMHRDALPEDHLWGPRDDFKGPFYTESAAHFASEIGYHGCPAYKSLQRMFDPAHLWPYKDNEQWYTKSVRAHAKDKTHDYRIPLMEKQIKVLFPRVPTSIDRFVLASQVSQAEALKFFIERFRIGKWRRTGILWWNLRDGWPIISDAVVDYFMGRKLAYGYIKRVQADVCVMCAEAGEGDHEVVGVNDTLEPVRVRLTVRDAEFDAKALEAEAEVPANGRATLGSVPRCRAPACYLIEWTAKEVTYRNHYIAGPRPWEFARYVAWMRKMHLADEFMDLVDAADLD
jgi:beta-mannosidase